MLLVPRPAGERGGRTFAWLSQCRSVRKCHHESRSGSGKCTGASIVRQQPVVQLGLEVIRNRARVLQQTLVQPGGPPGAARPPATTALPHQCLQTVRTTTSGRSGQRAAYLFSRQAIHESSLPTAFARSDSFPPETTWGRSSGAHNRASARRWRIVGRSALPGSTRGHREANLRHRRQVGSGITRFLSPRARRFLPRCLARLCEHVHPDPRDDLVGFGFMDASASYSENHSLKIKRRDERLWAAAGGKVRCRPVVCACWLRPLRHGLALLHRYLDTQLLQTLQQPPGQAPLSCCLSW